MRQFALMVVMCGCGDDGVTKLPDAPLVPIDAAIDAPMCPPITGTGTVRSSGISAPETWTAAGSPHLVRFDTSINAAVTVEPCAVVQIGGDKSLTVRAGGSITALGSPGLPVTFERLDPSNSWATISALGGGRLSFTHTVITGGGDPLNTLPAIAGALDIAGTAPAISPVLHVDHVTISGSESQAVNLHDGGGFDPTSTDLTITGSTGAPIVTFARAMGTIPTGTYTGNAVDEIVIRGTGGPEVVAESTTLHARGVPYRVGFQPNAVLDVVGGTGVSTLTIEPGVTLKFSQGATMRINPGTTTAPATGALIAVGTAAQPIVFTSASATPAAGDWFGIWLGGAAAPATRIQHARIEYAGRASVSGSDSCVPLGQTGQNDAAIRILGGIPSSVFITDTMITNSARHGIDLGYRSDTKLNFLPTNTITVPGCRTTLERDISGACPVTVPCN